MADYERPILAAEEKFFNECNTGNGRQQHYQQILLWLWHDCCGVPVIVLLTKADTLRFPAFHHLIKDEGLTHLEAMSRVEYAAAQMLEKLRAKIESKLGSCKYPPKVYLSLACKLLTEM